MFFLREMTCQSGYPRSLLGFNIRPGKFLHRYKSRLIVTFDRLVTLTYFSEKYLRKKKKTITVHNDLDIN